MEQQRMQSMIHRDAPPPHVRADGSQPTLYPPPSDAPAAGPPPATSTAPLLVAPSASAKKQKAPPPGGESAPPRGPSAMAATPSPPLLEHPHVKQRTRVTVLCPNTGTPLVDHSSAPQPQPVEGSALSLFNAANASPAESSFPSTPQTLGSASPAGEKSRGWVQRRPVFGGSPSANLDTPVEALSPWGTPLTPSTVHTPGEAPDDSGPQRSGRRHLLALPSSRVRTGSSREGARHSQSARSHVLSASHGSGKDAAASRKVSNSVPTTTLARTTPSRQSVVLSPEEEELMSYFEDMEVFEKLNDLLSIMLREKPQDPELFLLSQLRAWEATEQALHKPYLPSKEYQPRGDALPPPKALAAVSAGTQASTADPERTGHCPPTIAADASSATHNTDTSVPPEQGTPTDAHAAMDTLWLSQEEMVSEYLRRERAQLRAAADAAEQQQRLAALQRKASLEARQRVREERKAAHDAAVTAEKERFKQIAAQALATTGAARSDEMAAMTDSVPLQLLQYVVSKGLLALPWLPLATAPDATAEADAHSVSDLSRRDSAAAAARLRVAVEGPLQHDTPIAFPAAANKFRDRIFAHVAATLQRQARARATHTQKRNSEHRSGDADAAVLMDGARIVYTAAHEVLNAVSTGSQGGPVEAERVRTDALTQFRLLMRLGHVLLVTLTQPPREWRRLICLSLLSLVGGEGYAIVPRLVELMGAALKRVVRAELGPFAATPPSRAQHTHSGDDELAMHEAVSLLASGLDVFDMVVTLLAREAASLLVELGGPQVPVAGEPDAGPTALPRTTHGTDLFSTALANLFARTASPPSAAGPATASFEDPGGSASMPIPQLLHRMAGIPAGTFHSQLLTARGSQLTSTPWHSLERILNALPKVTCEEAADLLLMEGYMCPDAVASFAAAALRCVRPARFDGCALHAAPLTALCAGAERELYARAAFVTRFTELILHHQRQATNQLLKDHLLEPRRTACPALLTVAEHLQAAKGSGLVDDSAAVKREKRTGTSSAARARDSHAFTAFIPVDGAGSQRVATAVDAVRMYLPQCSPPDATVAVGTLVHLIAGTTSVPQALFDLTRSNVLVTQLGCFCQALCAFMREREQRSGVLLFARWMCWLRRCLLELCTSISAHSLDSALLRHLTALAHGSGAVAAGEAAADGGDAARTPPLAGDSKGAASSPLIRQQLRQLHTLLRQLMSGSQTVNGMPVTTRGTFTDAAGLTPVNSHTSPEAWWWSPACDTCLSREGWDYLTLAVQRDTHADVWYGEVLCHIDAAAGLGLLPAQAQRVGTIALQHAASAIALARRHTALEARRDKQTEAGHGAEPGNGAHPPHKSPWAALFTATPSPDESHAVHPSCPSPLQWVAAGEAAAATPLEHFLIALSRTACQLAAATLPLLTAECPAHAAKVARHWDSLGEDAQLKAIHAAATGSTAEGLHLVDQRARDSPATPESAFLVRGDRGSVADSSSRHRQNSSATPASATSLQLSQRSSVFAVPAVLQPSMTVGAVSAQSTPLSLSLGGVSLPPPQQRDDGAELQDHTARAHAVHALRVHLTALFSGAAQGEVSVDRLFATLVSLVECDVLPSEVGRFCRLLQQRTPLSSFGAPDFTLLANLATRSTHAAQSLLDAASDEAAPVAEWEAFLRDPASNADCAAAVADRISPALRRTDDMSELREQLRTNAHRFLLHPFSYRATAKERMALGVWLQLHELVNPVRFLQDATLTMLQTFMAGRSEDDDGGDARSAIGSCAGDGNSRCHGEDATEEASTGTDGKAIGARQPPIPMRKTLEVVAIMQHADNICCDIFVASQPSMRSVEALYSLLAPLLAEPDLAAATAEGSEDVSTPVVAGAVLSQLQHQEILRISSPQTAAASLETATPALAKLMLEMTKRARDAASAAQPTTNGGYGVCFGTDWLTDLVHAFLSGLALVLRAFMGKSSGGRFAMLFCGLVTHLLLRGCTVAHVHALVDHLFHSMTGGEDGEDAHEWWQLASLMHMIIQVHLERPLTNHAAILAPIADLLGRFLSPDHERAEASQSTCVTDSAGDNGTMSLAVPPASSGTVQQWSREFMDCCVSQRGLQLPVRSLLLLLPLLGAREGLSPQQHLISDPIEELDEASVLRQQDSGQMLGKSPNVQLSLTLGGDAALGGGPRVTRAAATPRDLASADRTDMQSSVVRDAYHAVFHFLCLVAKHKLAAAQGVDAITSSGGSLGSVTTATLVPSRSRRSGGGGGGSGSGEFSSVKNISSGNISRPVAGRSRSRSRGRVMQALSEEVNADALASRGSQIVCFLSAGTASTGLELVAAFGVFVAAKLPRPRSSTAPLSSGGAQGETAGVRAGLSAAGGASRGANTHVWWARVMADVSSAVHELIASVLRGSGGGGGGLVSRGLPNSSADLDLTDSLHALAEAEAILYRPGVSRFLYPVGTSDVEPHAASPDGSDLPPASCVGKSAFPLPHQQSPECSPGAAAYFTKLCHIVYDFALSCDVVDPNRRRVLRGSVCQRLVRVLEGDAASELLCASSLLLAALLRDEAALQDEAASDAVGSTTVGSPVSPQDNQTVRAWQQQTDNPQTPPPSQALSVILDATRTGSRSLVKLHPLAQTYSHKGVRVHANSTAGTSVFTADTSFFRSRTSRQTSLRFLPTPPGVPSRSEQPRRHTTVVSALAHVILSRTHQLLLAYEQHVMEALEAALLPGRRRRAVGDALDALVGHCLGTSTGVTSHTYDASSSLLAEVLLGEPLRASLQTVATTLRSILQSGGALAGVLRVAAEESGWAKAARRPHHASPFSSRPARAASAPAPLAADGAGGSPVGLCFTGRSGGLWRLRSDAVVASLQVSGLLPRDLSAMAAALSDAVWTDNESTADSDGEGARGRTNGGTAASSSPEASRHVKAGLLPDPISEEASDASDAAAPDAARAGRPAKRSAAEVAAVIWRSYLCRLNAVLRVCVESAGLPVGEEAAHSAADVCVAREALILADVQRRAAVEEAQRLACGAHAPHRPIPIAPVCDTPGQAWEALVAGELGLSPLQAFAGTPRQIHNALACLRSAVLATVSSGGRRESSHPPSANAAYISSSSSNFRSDRTSITDCVALAPAIGSMIYLDPLHPTTHVLLDTVLHTIHLREHGQRNTADGAVRSCGSTPFQVIAREVYRVVIQTRSVSLAQILCCSSAQTGTHHTEHTFDTPHHHHRKLVQIWQRCHANPNPTTATAAAQEASHAVSLAHVLREGLAGTRDALLVDAFLARLDRVMQETAAAVLSAGSHGSSGDGAGSCPVARILSTVAIHISAPDQRLLLHFLGHRWTLVAEALSVVMAVNGLSQAEQLHILGFLRSMRVALGCVVCVGSSEGAWPSRGLLHAQLRAMPFSRMLTFVAAAAVRRDAATAPVQRRPPCSDANGDMASPLTQAQRKPPEDTDEDRRRLTMTLLVTLLRLRRAVRSRHIPLPFSSAAGGEEHEQEEALMLLASAHAAVCQSDAQSARGGRDTKDHSDSPANSREGHLGETSRPVADLRTKKSIEVAEDRFGASLREMQSLYMGSDDRGHAQPHTLLRSGVRSCAAGGGRGASASNKDGDRLLWTEHARSTQLTLTLLQWAAQEPRLRDSHAADPLAVLAPFIPHAPALVDGRHSPTQLVADGPSAEGPTCDICGGRAAAGQCRCRVAQQQLALLVTVALLLSRRTREVRGDDGPASAIFSGLAGLPTNATQGIHLDPFRARRGGLQPGQGAPPQEPPPFALSPEQIEECMRAVMAECGFHTQPRRGSTGSDDDVSVNGTGSGRGSDRVRAARAPLSEQRQRLTPPHSKVETINREEETEASDDDDGESDVSAPALSRMDNLGHDASAEMQLRGLLSGVYGFLVDAMRVSSHVLAAFRVHEPFMLRQAAVVLDLDYLDFTHLCFLFLSAILQHCHASLTSDVACGLTRLTATLCRSVHAAFHVQDHARERCRLQSAGGATDALPGAAARRNEASASVDRLRQSPQLTAASLPALHSAANSAEANDEAGRAIGAELAQAAYLRARQQQVLAHLAAAFPIVELKVAALAWLACADSWLSLSLAASTHFTANYVARLGPARQPPAGLLQQFIDLLTRLSLKLVAADWPTSEAVQGVVQEWVETVVGSDKGGLAKDGVVSFAHALPLVLAARESVQEGCVCRRGEGRSDVGGLYRIRGVRQAWAVSLRYLVNTVEALLLKKERTQQRASIASQRISGEAVASEGSLQMRALWEAAARSDSPAAKGEGGRVEAEGSPHLSNASQRLTRGADSRSTLRRRTNSNGRGGRGATSGFSVVTLAEVEAAHTPDKTWTVIDGVVYDITNLLRTHPGGFQVLVEASAGQDCTETFVAQHGSSGKVVKALEKLRVGILDRSVAAARHPPR